MTQVGCYLLHLYCDAENCEGAHHGRKYCWEYGENETFTKAKASARRQGWKLSKGRCDDNDRCPYCTGKMDPKTEDHG
jgi:hypothetical protein